MGRFRQILRPLPFLVAIAVATGCSEDAPSKPTPPPIPAPDTASPAPPATPFDNKLRVLTYNVLADPTFHEHLRVPALLDILEASGADVIALQEVAPWFIDSLRRRPWTKSYHFSRHGGEVVAPGGDLILSRYPIRSSRYVELPSEQRRGVLWSEIELGAEVLAVATVHLESPLEDGPLRRKQLERVFEILADYPRAILLGDFNFGDGEAEGAAIPSLYSDPWRGLNPDAPGYTWDMERSQMAREGAFAGEQSRRLDRILVRWPGSEPRKATIIGNRPVAVPGVFPSDHFGLVAEVGLPVLGREDPTVTPRIPRSGTEASR